MQNYQNEVIANMRVAEMERKSAKTRVTWEGIRVEAASGPQTSFYAPLLAQTGAGLIAIGQWLQQRYSETYAAARKTMEMPAIHLQTSEHKAVR